eukprot:c28725_g1_i3 orf=989-1297(-)
MQKVGGREASASSREARWRAAKEGCQSTGEAVRGAQRCDVSLADAHFSTFLISSLSRSPNIAGMSLEPEHDSCSCCMPKLLSKQAGCLYHLSKFLPRPQAAN